MECEQVEFDMTTYPMTFDEWCYSERIRGNFKETLYHSLATKYGVEKIESLGQETWASEWFTIYAMRSPAVNPFPKWMGRTGWGKG